MRKKCSVEWCDAPVFKSGYCSAHYSLRKDAPVYLLSSRTPYAPRKKRPIKKVSPKKSKVLAAQREIKRQLPYFCFFCNVHKAVDPVHIIRQSYSLALQDDPVNIVGGCRRCHAIFDDGDPVELPNIKMALKLMSLLDYNYYIRYCTSRELSIDY
jgi:hypothetical protein